MAISDPYKHISLIAAATALSAFSLASMLKYTDPSNSGWVVYVLVYLSAFLLAVGIFTLLGLLARRIWLKGLFSANLLSSFRQALFLSMLLLACLILLASGLLYWWVALSVILPVIALEAFLNLKI